MHLKRRAASALSVVYEESSPKLMSRSSTPDSLASCDSLLQVEAMADSPKRCRVDGEAPGEESAWPSPSRLSYDQRFIGRVAAEIAGVSEMVALITSLPRGGLLLSERTELAILELNTAMLQQKNSRGQTVAVKQSRSLCGASKTRPSSVVAEILAAVGDADPTPTLVRHLTEVTYPKCSAAVAAKHVFEAPAWLQPWCGRHGVDWTNVEVVELTLFDGHGRGSNAMLFPLLGAGNHFERRHRR